MKAAYIILGAIVASAGAVVWYEVSQGGSLSNPFDPVNALAVAIATAEGFYVSGSRPQRDNNPGDMTVDIIGKGVGMDGSFIVYATADDGWANLKAQIQKWFDGTSANANSSSTISDLSSFYTDTQQSDWANNVASALGVSTDTPISDIGSQQGSGT